MGDDVNDRVLLEAVGFSANVPNAMEKVRGVLTDGDIRRAFIRGYNVENRVCEIIVREYQVSQETSSLSETIDHFKDTSIKFLPVIDEENQLVNVITKAMLSLQMHNRSEDDIIRFEDQYGRV